ncbi:MAG: YlxR family protein [Spirulina sp. DLM2.Bin59]|nr:MAG: YlxR family protein [Spirulina sp. DLM2.Bin59]
MPPNHRRCLACRRIGTKSEFWRIVRLHPTGTVQLDQGMGRSAYLCPQVRCLQIAQKKNRLGRSLKTPVPDAIYDHLRQRLTPQPHPTVNNPQDWLG